MIGAILLSPRRPLSPPEADVWSTSALRPFETIACHSVTDRPRPFCDDRRSLSVLLDSTLSGLSRLAARGPTVADEIAITRALHTAGSFLGDFPTPEGVRNSSREQTGGKGIGRQESGHSTSGPA